jgi:hypothetical protein
MHKLPCPTCDESVPEVTLENTSGFFAVAFDLTGRAIFSRRSASGTAVPISHIDASDEANMRATNCYVSELEREL